MKRPRAAETLDVSAYIELRCGGCDARAWAGTVRKVFRSFTGRSYGFGTERLAVDLKEPEGWKAFDPWTYCSYCPKCWAEILDHDSEKTTSPEDS